MRSYDPGKSFSNTLIVIIAGMQKVRLKPIAVNYNALAFEKNRSDCFVIYGTVFAAN